MKVLTPEQKAFYEAEGYLVLPGFISGEWLTRIEAAMDRAIAHARTLTTSPPAFVLEPGHTPENPRMRRVQQTGAVDKDLAEFGTDGPVVDIAEDLLGPSVRLHHSKLNFKWPDGGEEIDWHQDIQFWPHTNYSPLTIGVYLCDVDDEMGPMGVFPKSHEGELYTLRDATGTWTGSLTAEEIAALDHSSIAWCKGPKGTVTVHNARMVHGSEANNSPRMRPLLLHTYASGDARPITNLLDGVPYSNIMVRGEEPAEPRHDPRPCPMPPDFRAGTGYTSIFASQGKGEV